MSSRSQIAVLESNTEDALLESNTDEDLVWRSPTHSWPPPLGGPQNTGLTSPGPFSIRRAIRRSVCSTLWPWESHHNLWVWKRERRR